MNSSPKVLEELNNIPVKVVSGATIFVKDVAVEVRALDPGEKSSIMEDIFDQPFSA